MPLDNVGVQIAYPLGEGVQQRRLRAALIHDDFLKATIVGQGYHQDPRLGRLRLE